MLYVVSEDSKSGADIWRSVAHFLRYERKLKVVVVPAKSNRGVCSAEVFRELERNNISAGDIILCALDKISEARHIMKIMENWCFDRSVICIATHYYSTEEMLLSYTKWQQVSPYVKYLYRESENSPLINSVKEMFEYVHKSIYANPKYGTAPLDSPACENFCTIALQGNTSLNKERTLTALLSQFARRGIFSISGKNMTLCWLHRCAKSSNAIICPYMQIKQELNNKTLVSPEERKLMINCENFTKNCRETKERLSHLQFKPLVQKTQDLINNSILKDEMCFDVYIKKYIARVYQNTEDRMKLYQLVQQKNPQLFSLGK